MPANCTLVDGDSPACYCPLSGVIDVLGRKYAMNIICIIGAHDTVRFADIEAHLMAASTTTLSARLDELVDADLVARTQYDEIPSRVEYTLTDDGHDLCNQLEPVLEWAEER